MFGSLKQRVVAASILLVMAIVFLLIWMHDSSYLKIKLWRIPSEPSAPRVKSIDTFPVINLLGSSAQKNNPDAWSLQLGTFSDPNLAQQLVAQSQAKDLPAYVETTVTPKATLTTVYVGPELTQDSLQKLVANLDQNFKIKGSVVIFHLE